MGKKRSRPRKTPESKRKRDGAQARKERPWLLPILVLFGALAAFAIALVAAGDK